MASIKSSIARIVATTPKPAHGGTYYYELDQTYYSVTSSTFIGQVLGLLGLKSIADSAKGAAASGGYPQLSGEYILQANPDYIFLADTICCQQSAATVSTRPGWSTMSAVKRRTDTGVERRHRVAVGPEDRGPPVRGVQRDQAASVGPVVVTRP